MEQGGVPHHRYSLANGGLSTASNHTPLIEQRSRCLSLQTADRNGKRIAFLKFERVSVPLPITGTVDVAPLLPVLPLPTDTSWTVAAEAGNVKVRTLLTEARMGAKNLRLTYILRFFE